MHPRFTKHYALGLLVGTGFGLFLAYLLEDAGIVTDAATRKKVGAGFGIVCMMIGGTLYGLDLRRAAAPKGAGPR